MHISPPVLGLSLVGAFLLGVGMSSLYYFIFGPLGWLRQDRRFGRFEGTPETKWNDDGRFMSLTKDFLYFDPRGTRWIAPEGSQINGASIPPILWSLVGGPYEGKYRNASIVHDVACEQQIESWEDVHEMFYNACRCGGLDEWRSKMIYLAVYHRGPRWVKADPLGPPCQPKKPLRRPQSESASIVSDEEFAKRAKELMSGKMPSLQEIRETDLNSER